MTLGAGSSPYTSGLFHIVQSKRHATGTIRALADLTTYLDHPVTRKLGDLTQPHVFYYLRLMLLARDNEASIRAHALLEQENSGITNLAIPALSRMSRLVSSFGSTRHCPGFYFRIKHAVGIKLKRPRNNDGSWRSEQGLLLLFF